MDWIRHFVELAHAGNLASHVTGGQLLGGVGHAFELAVVGVVSALFTSLLERKRFVTERWWDRKADAYTRILQALVEMHRHQEAYLEDLTHEAELSAERNAELTAASKGAWRDVDNAIRMGDFVISQQAHTSLTKLRAPTRGVHPNDLYGLVAAEYAATTACIGQLRKIGRRELQVAANESLWSRVTRLTRKLHHANAPEVAKP